MWCQLVNVSYWCYNDTKERYIMRKRFTFRIDEDLYNKIQEIADKEHRSVTAQIIVIVEDYLKSHQDVSEEQQSPKN